MPAITYQKTPDFYIEKYTQRRPMTEMHYHKAYELYYTIEGERDYYVGDRHFKLNKHDLLFIPTAILHRTVGKGATRFLIYFTQEHVERFFAAEALARLLPNEPFVFRPKKATAQQMNEAFSALLAEQTEQESPDELKLSGWLFRILLLISTEENTYTPPPQEDRLSAIVRYVNTHFSSIEKIEDIAERFFISKYHLCHMFKKHLDVPLISYLNTIRIQAACKMLKKGDMKLSDVAEACGFNSTTYFCKVFKDEMGISPGKYCKLREE